MHAKFFAVGSFLLRSRKMFVAFGDVTEGQVQPGMTLAVSLGSVSVTTKVKAVEFVDIRDQAYTGLVFDLEDTADLEFWQSLKIGGETLELSMGDGK